VYNSTGGQITTATIATSGTPYQCSVACLTNDTFVIGTNGNGSSSALVPRFYLLPTGNVLSSLFAVPITNVPIGGGVGGNTWNLQIKGLSSNGFVYFLGDGNGAMYYVFYSAAGGAAYSTPKIFPGPIFYNLPQALMGIAETTGYLSLYYSLYGTNATYEMFNTKIDLTTYLPYSAVTTTSPVGSTSAASGAYARSTSLPMKAAYLAANTETLSLDATVSSGNSYTVAPASVSGSTIDSIKSATLPDGRFVIAYKDVSTQAVSFNVYSITGVLQTTVAVGTGAITARVRVTTLPNGKVIVAYLTSGTVLTVAVYSSSFTFISSINITGTYSSTLFDVTGLSTNRIALVYQQASQSVVYAVYSDALVAVSGINTVLAVTTVSELSVVATINSGFWVKFTNSGTSANVHYYYFVASSTNAYTSLVTNGATGTTFSTSATCALAVNPSNFAMGFSASAATTGEFCSFTPNNGTSQFTFQSVSTFSTNTMANTSNVAVGVTGMGTFVCFLEGNSTFNLLGFTGTPTIANVSTAAVPYGLLSGITKSTSYGMQACITPSYGYNAVIAWINSGNTGQFAIVNAYPFGATQVITAGVTGSAPTTPLNISQSSGYFLAGVAVSDCPAGGTGQIQTNGVANLNSQYSTSTAFQGFDFQNPVTIGVRGTAVGRTVTMIKD
jgi:hypothetical protein